ncbi:MAG: Gldg family protein [Anaerolineales bacterium]|jgi:ABC-2 type transport system permease protein|nr:Gldg family protein [Anaerolineales bacterium]
MKQALIVTRKELNSYFGSPMALIFVGVFLAASLFTFFWVDTFFSRGIADVRPLFNWMPLLLIFLVAALTMRQWSEEQHSGTLEILLTLPVRLVDLVFGKFLAVMALVCVALVLTVFLPITVSLLGNLDWGPVIGGYLAAVLMAASYAAIGLYISARTDNQLVALIVTALVGGAFYLVGARGLTDFFGDQIAEIFRAVGSGARFESIERGVVDLRDLAYYISLTGIFLALNALALESQGWSEGERTLPHRRRISLTVMLVIVNLVILNVWLFPLRGLRIDLTSQREYSLSRTTRDLLSNVQEPLLIRGYFSDKTHPLLAPLVPRIRDTLQEYRLASNGNLVIEIVDPLQDPEKETEANQTYGIRPTPLQAADRYGTSVVNAYFDILVRYGDQHVVLNFADLIEVEPYRSGQIDVRLRNLEYDLTRAIKKVIYGFQSIETVLGALDDPVKLTVYTTPNTLPDSLQDAPAAIRGVAAEIASESGGNFAFEMVDIDSAGSLFSHQELYDRYGLQPIPVSFFSPDTYYLYMLLEIGSEAQVLYPSGDFSEASIRTVIESALKRASTGFLKVIGLWTPPDMPQQSGFGQQMPSLKSYEMLEQTLRENYTVRLLDLADGEVPPDVDVLMVIAPQDMSDAQRYAIDQYLMRGGAVVAAAGNYIMQPDQFTGGLGLLQVTAGMQEMLASYGTTVEQKLVLDAQNEPFPVPVTRDLGGIEVREIRAMSYPFFVDVRPDGMDRESPIMATLQAVTLNWPSPIAVDDTASADREITVLLQSSPGSWTTSDTNIQPDTDLYPELGFPLSAERKPYILAVSVQGVFESFFKGKQSPLEEIDEITGEALNPDAVGTLESSPPTARLVVFSSAEFLNDTVFNLSSNLSGNRYFNSLQLAQNVVDWAVEDLDLLSIRSRGTASRPLAPLSERQQAFWESTNYLLALLALGVLGWSWRARRRNEQPMVLSSNDQEDRGGT